jgi:hypothetical protein
MIKFQTITENIFKMPRFSYVDGDPQLSKPVLFKKDGKLLCVIMEYEDTYEGLPDGYVFVDMEDGSCSYMDAAPAMDYMGMPDEIVFGEANDDRIPRQIEDDISDLFDGCINEKGIDSENYKKYLELIVDSATPVARKFYGWFSLD